ncbi:MAG TPA: 3-hydroxyacyl-ACP dehydratase FabZ [Acidobacteriaceae bacterium]
MIERREIEAMIPHRAPFLWIERVLELEPGVRCMALMLVQADNPIFAGHFPGWPVLPGALLIEATAQTAGVMLASAAARGVTGRAMLASVNRFKFLKPVLPGEELRIETTTLTSRGKMACISGSVRRGEEIVASGELSVVCDG